VSTTERLADLRAAWELRYVTKKDYARAIWPLHQRLFEYPEFLRGTNVSAIEIVEEGVIVTLRSPAIRLWCPPTDRASVGMKNLTFGQEEEKELAILLKLARFGGTFFDIGANVGLYSIAYWKRFPMSEVIAFEAVLSTRKELWRNIALNKVCSIDVKTCGLSHENGSLKFYFDPTIAGAAAGAPLGDEFENAEVVTCPVMRMDDLALPDPHVIKCDVEGMELLVFQGGEKTIARALPIIQCEMLRKWAKRFGYHPNDIIAFLGKFGYQCFRVQASRLVPFAEMTDETVETNFYFLHPEKHKGEICTQF
jgi:FkbM family methyltransferase